ncbi:hypothetical protein ACGFMK_25965 [Amycolatopsis sp. NPDC049252]|uniref:hypothetical protein n=1 Tax=Amycolatopsis sp. NPDC049252 TaxID=3363933 RepID=UPI0037212056
MTGDLQAVIREMAKARGAIVEVTGDRVTATVRGRTATLDLPADAAAVDVLADLPSAFPSRAARGDIREKTLYNIVQDMVEVESGSRLPDAEFRSALPDQLHADASSRRVLASVIQRQYWFHPRATRRSAPATFLTPFHADLPGAYDYPGRYKSFRGSLLLFLCFDGGDFDLSLAADVLDFMRSDDGLNPLDREVLRAARAVAARDRRKLVHDPERLLELDASLRPDSQIRARLSRGAFDQSALDLIRRDLGTVMTLRLPRHDKVAALVLALSLHVALYYYRIAFALGEGLEGAAVALDGGDLGPRPAFGQAVRFRVGSGGDRPVSGNDPCARAWWHLDEQHLLALPASMVSANVLHAVTRAVLGPAVPQLPDPYDCAAALRADPAAVQLAELLCACAAAGLTHVTGGPLEAHDPGAGGYALRAAALGTFRGRGSALKQRGRDVVNTMVGGFGGNLRRNRGRVRFFELDEQVLFLLVKLVLDGAGVEQMALQTAFLPALQAYGLAPQDAAEEELLADALQRLGLLDRYSDAGEATYVRHVS